MFPFSIVHKLEKKIPDNKVYISALNRNLKGYELKFVKRNTYELRKIEKKLFSQPMLEVTTEIEYSSENIKIISTNSWGIGLAAVFSFSVISSIFISISKGDEPEYGTLALIPIFWLILPSLLFFNYLFRISIIKEIKRRIHKENNKAQSSRRPVSQ